MSASPPGDHGSNNQKQYNMNDETVAYLNQLADMGLSSELSVSAVRENCLARVRRFGGEVKYEGVCQDFSVPSVDCKDGIPITVYIPKDRPSRSSILVYFHGGGWTLGCREMVDVVCKSLSKSAECSVVNVEYRLAPEHKFPACFNDAKSVLRWVKLNKSLLGGVNSSVVGVAGESAGGTIAASVCHEVKGIGYQVLIYPMLDMRCSYPSYEQFKTGPILNEKIKNWFFENLLNNENEKTNPRASPLLRESFQGLPPALFIVSELDSMKDDSHEYAKRLRASGIKTKSMLVRGVCHGFFCLPGHFKESCRKAYAEISHFIKSQSDN